MKSGNTAFDPAIERKAFEIAYALVRAADTISPDPFSGHFKDLGLKLLCAVTLGSGKRAIAVSRSIEYFVRLAGSAGAISSQNSEVVAEEASALTLQIVAAMSVPSGEHFDITGVFTPAPAVSGEGKNSIREEQEEKAESGRKDRQISEINIKTQIRQSAILEKIRQSGNLPNGKAGCRMLDLRLSFPDVSERTLRYDLEILVERGLVDRVGSSGPSTTYRARQISTA